MADNRIDIKHTDQYLSNFIQRFASPNDGGEFVAPSFRVMRPSDKYLIYGKDTTRVFDDKIGRRMPIREVDMNATEGTYSCVEYGVGAFVYDRDLSNIDSAIRLWEEKAAHAKNTKERNRSYRVFSVAASTSLVPNTAMASAWSTHSSATPVANILDAMINVEAGCGFPANAIVMNYQVALTMIQSTEWKEYFHFTDAGFKNGLFNAISGLTQLGLEPKIIGDRGVSSLEGCASDPGWDTILGDKVIIFKRETSPTTQSNCFMFSPYVTKDEVKKFYIEKERGYELTVRDDIDELLVNADAGYILDDVL